MHLEIKKDTDYTFTLDLYSYGIQDVPSAVTVAILDNGGTSVQTGAATIATDGTASYLFLAANNDSQANNFKLVWTVTVSGTDTTYNQLFDVTLTPINNTVRDEDLFLHCSELRDRAMIVNKTTNSGSTTTLISSQLTINNREWLGGELEIYIDDTTVHKAKITAYVKSSGTVTFSPAYAITIPTAKNFLIRTSYQEYIDEAYTNFVYRDIKNKVKIVSGYIDNNVFRNLTVYKALEIICKNEYEEIDDKWYLRYIDFQKAYSNELGVLSEAYDNDESGDMSDREDEERPSFWNAEYNR